jgi:hypothetical protein
MAASGDVVVGRQTRCPIVDLDPAGHQVGQGQAGTNNKNSTQLINSGLACLQRRQWQWQCMIVALMHSRRRRGQCISTIIIIIYMVVSLINLRLGVARHTVSEYMLSKLILAARLVHGTEIHTYIHTYMLTYIHSDTNINANRHLTHMYTYRF